MKKSLFTMLIAVFALSACDDKTAQKLREAEQRITQLESDYQRSQESLKAKEMQLAQVQAAFPALQVEIVDFFNKRETVNAANEPEVTAQVAVSRAKTGVEWLDLLLLKESVLYFRIDEVDLYPFTEQKAAEFFQDLLVENQYFAKREKVTHFDGVTPYYVGQRNNIATFKLQFFGYSGGASTSTDEMYVNVDINKQAVILREDLVAQAHEAQLWGLLDKYDAQQNGEASDRKLSDGDYRYAKYSFYFTEEGVNFVFSPQHKVQVPYDELKAIMNKDYYPKEWE